MNTWEEVSIAHAKADRERRELRMGDSAPTFTDTKPEPLPAGARIYRVSCHNPACPQHWEPYRQWAVNAADTVPAWCRWCNDKATAKVEVIP